MAPKERRPARLAVAKSGVVVIIIYLLLEDFGFTPIDRGLYTNNYFRRKAGFYNLRREGTLLRIFITKVRKMVYRIRRPLALL
jgi:hypothetical protein